MRDEGVSLLFLSGNAVCWVTPFRESHDGRPNRIIFRGGPYGDENDYAQPPAERERTVSRARAGRGPADGGVGTSSRSTAAATGSSRSPSHWIFDGTGLKNGDRIPGLIGWEYHGDPPKLPGLEIVAAGTAWVGGQVPQKWTATIYPGPKGNFVFNASTIFWAQGLSSPPGHTLPWSHWSRPARA